MEPTTVKLIGRITELEEALLKQARRLAEVYSLEATPRQNDVDKFYVLLRNRFDDATGTPT